tara:strand:- start:246 stop:401 length:156 start_codon:yes stop_codon:yes gene_type:complete
MLKSITFAARITSDGKSMAIPCIFLSPGEVRILQDISTERGGKSFLKHGAT